MELGYISIAQTSALIQVLLALNLHLCHFLLCIQLLSGTKCIEPLKPKVLVIKRMS